jgi:putative ABC transport system permease protein
LADWKRRTTAFQALNACGTNNFIIAAEDRPEYFDGMEATPGYYRMLGNPFFLGRNFLPEEGEPGKEHVVILTNRLWQHLGADPKIIGQSMQVNGEPHTVVGVMAPGTADRWDWELFVPLVLKPKEQLNHAARYWLVTGRLKPGVAVQQAQAEMDAIAAQEAKDYPTTNQGWGALVEPYKNDFLPSERRRMLWLLLGAVGFLLLIACLNVANLLVAKSMTRRKEVAIRGALGARPASIFAQFLTESLTLAILGGLLGISVGSLLLRGLVAVIPADALPAEADLRLNVPILMVILARRDAGRRPVWLRSRVVRLTP